MDGAVAVRDRALIAVIAYSGVRGGEVLRDPRDEHRRGLRWSDVDLEDGTLRVLGKSQNWEFAQLPRQAERYLRAHRRRQNPDRTPIEVVLQYRHPNFWPVATQTILFSE